MAIIEAEREKLEKLGYIVNLVRPEESDEPAWVAPTAKRAYTKKTTAKKTTATKKSKAAGGVKFCPICNAETPTFPHDGRAHRYQTKKKAFTEAELKELAAKK